jgi:hypothetical protein
MQYRKNFPMELVHDVHVVALTCVVLSSAPNKTLPVVGMELHEILPAPVVLLWGWEPSSVLQVSVHPKEIVSDQLDPVVVRVEQTPAGSVRALI